MRGSSEAGAGMARLSDGPLVGRGALMEELVAAADGGRARRRLDRCPDRRGGNRQDERRTGARASGSRPARRLVGRVRRRSERPTLLAVARTGRARAVGPVARRPIRRSARHGSNGSRRCATNWPRQVVERPRLHVIEDLQWADVASVLLLAHLGPAIVDAAISRRRHDAHRRATVRHNSTTPSSKCAALSSVRHLPALEHDDIAALIRGAGVEPDEHTGRSDHGADGREPAVRHRVAAGDAGVRHRRTTASERWRRACRPA